MIGLGLGERRRGQEQRQLFLALVGWSSAGTRPSPLFIFVFNAVPDRELVPRDRCAKVGKVYRPVVRNRRAPFGGRFLAEPSPVKVSTARHTGYRVQGFVAEDTSEDGHVYEPVTCPVCHQIHHVNPHTGAVLGEKAQ
jgi:hypothetical protein